MKFRARVRRADRAWGFRLACHHGLYRFRHGDCQWHPGGGASDTLSLITLRVDASSPDPLWYRILDTERIEQVPEVSISADSGKIYLVRGAYLEVLDAMSGRLLGEWAVPGLDEQVAWNVVDGAGLLAEERRISIFELPA